MKKLFISSMLVVGAVALTSAEEVAGSVGPVQVKAPAPAVKMVKAVLATSTKPQMMGDELRNLLTGDKAVDEKVKALIEERDRKVRAAHEEFQTKLKALIGERKLIRASTTEKMKDEMRERMMYASGTPMNASGTPARKGEVRPPVQQEQNRNLFKRFIQSLLGGNPQELQAEEVR